jgi:hypothetical protein
MLRLSRNIYNQLILQLTPRGKLRFCAAAKSRKFWPHAQKMLFSANICKNAENGSKNENCAANHSKFLNMLLILKFALMFFDVN